MVDWEKATDRVLEIGTKTFDPGTIYYLPVGGSPVKIPGVFSRAHVDIDTGDGPPTSSYRPILGVRLTDLPCAPSSKDLIQVKGVDYKIIDSQEDEAGGATLILQEA